MNDFITLFTLAKAGDSAAVEVILNMYRPLLYKESMQQGIFNEETKGLAVIRKSLSLFIRSVQSLFATKDTWFFSAGTE